VKQLLDQVLREPLNLFAQLRRQALQPPEMLIELTRPDRLELPVEALERRLDPAALEPLVVAARLLVYNSTTPLELQRPSRSVLTHLGLEIVDVAEVDAVEPAHTGLDIARHRDVDHKKRPPLPAVHHPAHRAGGEHRTRARGRGDHDISPG
jgi:hypothetical protein